MQLRTITRDDYQQLIEFWRENYSVAQADDRDHFLLFLEKNAELSVLMEEGGEITATALGSYDGRRGYLQKVVVKKELRQKGTGTQVVKEVIERLKAVGACYIPISVEKELIPFYEKCGFVVQDSCSLSMDVTSATLV